MKRFRRANAHTPRNLLLLLLSGYRRDEEEEEEYEIKKRKKKEFQTKIIFSSDERISDGGRRAR